MEIELTELQRQVDNQIEQRLSRICRTEWEKVNLIKGNRRKKTVPVTYSQTVNDLLELRQMLYNGTDPEAIAATLNSGDIDYKFRKA